MNVARLSGFVIIHCLTAIEFSFFGIFDACRWFASKNEKVKKISMKISGSSNLIICFPCLFKSLSALLEIIEEEIQANRVSVKKENELSISIYLKLFLCVENDN